MGGYDSNIVLGMTCNRDKIQHLALHSTIQFTLTRTNQVQSF